MLGDANSPQNGGNNTSSNAVAQKHKLQQGKEDKVLTKKAKNDEVKKTVSPYVYFVADYRQILKKNGIKQLPEVSTQCSLAWKSMTEEEKKPYVEKSLVDRKRYEGEREIKPKDPSKPKRAQTAYFYFLADYRKENKDRCAADGTNLTREAGHAWGQLDEEGRKQYKAMEDTDKERYTADMVKWKSAHPEEAQKKPASKKKELQKVEPEPEPEAPSENESDSLDSDSDSDEDSSSSSDSEQEQNSEVK